MNSRFAKNHKKEQEQKLKYFEKFERRKNIKFKPYSQSEDIVMTGQML